MPSNTNTKILYTTNDLIKMFGRSRQRYEQLRNGHYNNKFVKGVYTYYKKEPFLIHGIDWNMKNGNVVFTASAVKKLKKKFEEG